MRGAGELATTRKSRPTRIERTLSSAASSRVSSDVSSPSLTSGPGPSTLAVSHRSLESTCSEPEGDNTSSLRSALARASVPERNTPLEPR